ncbi:hypothetical protein [Parachlamydia acanthamoebae]|uniref:hypothetical protein n=1 Tax=Parachlamydia acanthamoebae TaxID=83552 RepID=UPI000B333F7C|nr:hypothetical protein [Parachlamydia acanthamoebae]
MLATLANPWETAWKVLGERPDFAAFQMGFMLGASALMMIHTILPSFLWICCI